MVNFSFDLTIYFLFSFVLNGSWKMLSTYETMSSMNGTSTTTSTTGLSSRLEQQYQELHRFILQTVEDIREDLYLVDFLTFLSVYFELDSEPRALFFTQYMGFYHEQFPYEIDAIAYGKADELKLALFRSSPSNLFSVDVAKAAREIFLHFLSSREDLRKALFKYVQLGTSPDLPRVSKRSYLIKGAEMLLRHETKLDVDQNKKLMEIKWAVSRRMRMYSLNAGPSTSALLDSFKYTPDAEPPMETQFFSEYVEKLLPPVPPAPPGSSASKESTKRIKQITSDVPVKWPSIAMASFYDSTNLLISMASSAHDLGKCVAAGFENGTARVYTASSETKEFGTSSQVLIGHSQPVYGVAVHDGRVVTCAGDGQARLWIPTPVSAPNSPPSYKNAIVYDEVSSVPLFSSSYGPFGHIFACGGRGGIVKLFSIEHQTPLRTFVGSHLDDVNTVQFHPNSHFILSGSCDRTVRLWDVREGKVARTIAGLSCSIESIACDPSGRLVALGGSDGTVSIVDLVASKRLKLLSFQPPNKKNDSEQEVVYSISWSSDGRYLASTSGRDVYVTSMEWTETFLDDIPYDERLNGSAGEELFKRYRTKCDPLVHVNFIKYDVLLAGGASLTPPS